jgi:hypothetical protein
MIFMMLDNVLLYTICYSFQIVYISCIPIEISWRRLNPSRHHSAAPGKRAARCYPLFREFRGFTRFPSTAGQIPSSSLTLLNSDPSLCENCAPDRTMPARRIVPMHIACYMLVVSNDHYVSNSVRPVLHIISCVPIEISWRRLNPSRHHSAAPGKRAARCYPLFREFRGFTRFPSTAGQIPSSSLTLLNSDPSLCENCAPDRTMPLVELFQCTSRVICEMVE